MKRSLLVAVALSSILILALGAGVATAKADGRKTVKNAPGQQLGQTNDVIVVKDGESIQAAIDDAESGDTIVVYPGTYQETLEINKEDLTVKSKAAPQSVIIKGRIVMSAEGTTLNGFTVNPKETFTTSQKAAGILITASNTVAKNNIVKGVVGDSTVNKIWMAANGIQVWSANKEISNIVIKNNVVKDIKSYGFNPDYGKWGYGAGTAGIKVQGNVDGVYVTNNEIENLWSEGWSWGITVTTTNNAPSEIPEDVVVKRNSMDDISAEELYGIAFGVSGDAREVTFEYNNIWTEYGVQNKDLDHTLVVENNWWGHPSGPGDKGAKIYGDGDVDYEPWLKHPVPGMGK